MLRSQQSQYAFVDFHRFPVVLVLRSFEPDFHIGHHRRFAMDAAFVQRGCERQLATLDLVDLIAKTM